MAEKMLTNWFTFLLYKFLKVGGRGGPGGGARHRPQLGGREWPRPWRDAPGTCVCPLASPEAVQFSLSCQGKVEVSHGGRWPHAAEQGGGPGPVGFMRSLWPRPRLRWSPWAGRLCPALALAQPEEVPGREGGVPSTPC